jgi:hypothetical protein
VSPSLTFKKFNPEKLSNLSENIGKLIISGLDIIFKHKYITQFGFSKSIIDKYKIGQKYMPFGDNLIIFLWVL